MIGRAVLGAVVAITTSVPSVSSVPDGAITISMSALGRATTVRVDPDGRMTADGPAVAATDERGDYPRFAAFLEPARAYAGKAVPCARPLSGELGRRMGKPAPATIHWQATGETVRIDLNCMTQAEPYFGIREALDMAKRWGLTPRISN